MVAMFCAFCRDRKGPDGKVPIIRRCKITHFIDDHDEVLKAIYDDTETRKYINQNSFTAENSVGPHKNTTKIIVLNIYFEVLNWAKSCVQVNCLYVDGKCNIKKSFTGQ